MLLRAWNEPSLDLNPRRAAQRVRLISTAAPDLVKASKQGHFRSRLYYRLVCCAGADTAPTRAASGPLRCWPTKSSRRPRHKTVRSSARPRAVQLLTGYSWPGNLRELFNVMGQALLRLRGHWSSARRIWRDCSTPSPLRRRWIPHRLQAGRCRAAESSWTLVAHGCIKHCHRRTRWVSLAGLCTPDGSVTKQGAYWLPHRGRRQQSDSLDHRPAQVPPSRTVRSRQTHAPSQTAQG